MQTPFYNLSSTRSYNNISGSTSSSASTSALQSLLPPPPINPTSNRPNRPRRKRSHGNVNNSNSLEAIDELPLSEDAHERGWIDGLQIRMGNGYNSTNTREEDISSINGRETKRIRPSLDSFEPAFASLNLSSPSSNNNQSSNYYNNNSQQHYSNFNNFDKTRDFNHNNNNNSTRFTNVQPSLIPYTILPPTPTPTIPTPLPSSSSSSSLLPVTPPMQQGENHNTSSSSSLSTSNSNDSLCPPPIFSPGYGSSSSNGSRFSPTTPFGSPIDVLDRSTIGDIKMGGTNSFNIGPNKIWVNSLDDSDDEEEVTSKKLIVDKAKEAVLAASGVGTSLPDLLPKSVLAEVSKGLLPPRSSQSDELGLVLYKPLKFGGILGDKEEKDLAFENYQRDAQKEEREEEVIEINVGANNGDGMMEEVEDETVQIHLDNREQEVVVEDDMMDLDF